MSASRSRSGRPEPGEYSRAHIADVEALPGDDVVEILRRTAAEVGVVFGNLNDETATRLRYRPEKWTPKDILQHLIDDERSYAWRVLSIARGDERPQPGFDENLYARHAGAGSRRLADLLSEHAVVRASTVAMFASLPADAWSRSGFSNGEPVTVRGLGFQMAAHEHHHLGVLRERYLPLLEGSDA